MTPFGPDHYVPVLKCKRGEKKALESLHPSVRQSVTPLVDVVELKAGKTLDQHLDTAFNGLAAAIGSRSCFLDARELAPIGSTAAASVFTRAQAAAIPFVPVTGIGRADVVAALGHAAGGVCLRLTRSDLEAGRYPQEILSFLTDHSLSPANVDLVMDMGPIEEMVPAGAARLAQAFLRAVPNHTGWRTFTLVGAAFPLSMRIVDRNSHRSIDRVEWQCWRTYMHGQRARLHRVPTFGDYAIQHPTGVEGFDPRVMQVSATIRYNTGDQWLLIKGQSTRTVPATVQFPQLADSLVHGVHASSFMGSAHCKGCEDASAAAAGQPRLGSAEVWRRLGTIHHITTSVGQIRALPSP